ncbi:hypothetical protein PV378_13765 [Streptomyces scabiei]|uniref:hypothetical protein n=1 Tax=Streptomyces scabiei TaxID=1930 RepID=UPI0029BF4847|nr:hypothetical protein [Streptomyces scabiei]MDX3047561.1 hypothetical protein [Streptomyces scabiei]
MTDTPKAEDPMVAALLRERSGYVGHEGKEDRVKAVDEQLRLRGYSPEGEPLSDDSAADAVDSGDGGAGKPENRTQAPKGRRTQRSETA